ncbi:hypothetical protein A9G48_01130 [Gilliamella sp. wkB18]|uniref:tail fiber assembly protein n=1 Tax=Gilliamella sp. wkB18 TaxID=3120260 RepID=UPI00080E2AF9|nr:tail fiber assembly protein [Gilliamella apicola]OCG65003.1 hypothetical protein A9G48_01130 [Gilliamella apicola]
MTIYYNAAANAFYDSEINIIPKNSIKISRELHAKLLQQQTDGMEIKSDENGRPVAIEYVLTPNEIIEVNKSKKTVLINEANEKIEVLQDIIDLDMQESNEEEMLKQWKKYRILLTRVDASDVNTKFPKKPKNS